MKEDFDITDVVDDTDPKQVPTTVMDEFEQVALAYIRTKDQVGRLTKETTKLRDKLLPILTEYGTESSGNFQIELPDEVLGVRTMTRQRRVSKPLSERAAQKLLKDRGLYGQCTKHVRVIDETAVMDALYDGKLTDEDIGIMFPTKETFALVMNK